MPKNFVLQSDGTKPHPAKCHQMVPIIGGCGTALWLQPASPNAPVRLDLEGLLPYRFYRIRPGRRIFVRTDRAGRLRALLQLVDGGLVIVEPVI